MLKVDVDPIVKATTRGCGISQHWIDEWGAWAAGRPVLLATALSSADLRPKVGHWPIALVSSVRFSTPSNKRNSYAVIGPMR